jgi:hypothetical protein
VHPELAGVLERRRQAYIAEHGLEPDADSPLFPSFASLSGQQVTDKLATAMKGAGFDAAFIYAFRKTGLIVTEMNRDLLPDKDLQEWADAVQEYRRWNTAPSAECGRN